MARFRQVGYPSRTHVHFIHEAPWAGMRRCGQGPTKRHGQPGAQRSSAATEQGLQTYAGRSALLGCPARSSAALVEEALQRCPSSAPQESSR